MRSSVILASLALLGGCATDQDKKGIASASLNYGVDSYNQPVVTGGKASVPHCPNWVEAGRDSAALTDPNYGCATNGNLAAMVADPQDLVQGRETRSILRTTTSSRAIKAYRDATPSGGGGNTLK